MSPAEIIVQMFRALYKQAHWPWPEIHCILGQMLPTIAVWGAGCHLKKYCIRLIISCLGKLSDQTAKSKFCWASRGEERA